MLTDPDTSVQGNVLTNDSDPEGDTLRAVAQQTVGSNGGNFILNADGSFDFSPNGAFDDLAPGQTRVSSISYVVVDDNGAGDTGLLSVVVTGVNKNPVAQPSRWALSAG